MSFAFGVFDLAASETADLVIVPNWRSGTQDPPEPVLASAGLLDDRPATTATC